MSESGQLSPRSRFDETMNEPDEVSSVGTAEVVSDVALVSDVAAVCIRNNKKGVIS